MNVFFWVIWGIVLDDPIDRRDIQTSSGNIGAEHDSRLSVTELEVRRSSLRLLLFAVNRKNRDVNVVKQLSKALNLALMKYYLVVELDTHTRRKKDHDLLLFVLFEECVQNSYPCITLRHDITLLQHIRCRCRFVIIDTDVHWNFFQ